MNTKTQKLRNQLVEAARRTEDEELLEAAYRVLTDTVAWDDLPKAVQESLERAQADIKAGRLISGEVFRDKHNLISNEAV